MLNQGNRCPAAGGSRAALIDLANQNTGNNNTHTDHHGAR